MEGRCAGVETSPSPFYSAASPPCEVGGQSRGGLLPDGRCGAKVDGRQPCPPGVDVNMTLLRVMFGSVFQSLSLPTTGS